MASLHPSGAECWLDVSRMGGHVNTHTRLIHRCVVCCAKSEGAIITRGADTMGYAFTFPVVSLLGNIPVGAYVHYPTISTAMVSRVKTRAAGHTNSEAISSSNILSAGKLL